MSTFSVGNNYLRPIWLLLLLYFLTHESHIVITSGHFTFSGKWYFQIPRIGLDVVSDEPSWVFGWSLGYRFRVVSHKVTHKTHHLHQKSVLWETSGAFWSEIADSRDRFQNDQPKVISKLIIRLTTVTRRATPRWPRLSATRAPSPPKWFAPNLCSMKVQIILF